MGSMYVLHISEKYKRRHYGLLFDFNCIPLLFLYVMCGGNAGRIFARLVMCCMQSYAFGFYATREVS
jgi:hypothetical protein